MHVNHGIHHIVLYCSLQPFFIVVCVSVCVVFDVSSMNGCVLPFKGQG